MPDGVSVCGRQAGSHHDRHVRFPDHNAALFDVSVAANTLMVRLQRKLNPRRDRSTRDALLAYFCGALNLLSDDYWTTIGTVESRLA